jgi:murein DD-endopeptidase MepM/ murein hydrolase activator NlpD
MDRKIDRAFALGVLFFVLCWLCAACEPSINSSTPRVPTQTSRLIPLNTATSPPTLPPGPTPEPTLTLPPVPTAPVSLDVCSPLQGIALNQLDQADLLKNPYEQPRPGYDDGHAGIDLAYWADSQGKPMRGLPVLSVLNGLVVGALESHQPYGNAVITETPLDQIPAAWRNKLDLPVPQRNLQKSFSLFCPDYQFTFDQQPLSLYILYAHLDQPVADLSGKKVACGEEIGVVGTTGRSVNPHLHLETRIGPAGMTFASMDHYDNAATQEEMRLYCLWRISGAFPSFDPLRLFKLAQQDR